MVRHVPPGRSCDYGPAQGLCGCFKIHRWQLKQSLQSRHPQKVTSQELGLQNERNIQDFGWKSHFFISRVATSLHLTSTTPNKGSFASVKRGQEALEFWRSFYRLPYTIFEWCNLQKLYLKLPILPLQRKYLYLPSGKIFLKSCNFFGMNRDE